MSRPVPVLVLAAALVGMTPTSAEAVPPFARRYRATCNLCHDPVPRLNAFGETFGGNGFQFMHGEEPRDTVATGDTLLVLQRALPIGMRIDAFLQARTSVPADETRVDLQTPYGIKLFSSAPITKNITYYLYFFLSERGEVAGLEDAYVQFSDLGGTGVSVILGQFQVSDPLFKRELRLEFEDYQVYRVRVGDTRADLTYDRGILAMVSPWEGGDLAIQVLNGRGLEPAGDNRQYDRDPFKNWALRLSQAVGPARIGVFGLLGTEKTDGVQNRFTVLGPDLTLSLGPVEVNGQYLWRSDDDPFFGAPDAPTDTDVSAALLEVIWTPVRGGRWAFTGLANVIDADGPVFTVRQGEEELLERYTSVALGANYLLRRNLRLLVEPAWDIERERLRLTAGFVTAF